MENEFTDFDFNEFSEFLSYIESEGKEIPDLLHSVYEDGPFKTCISCEKNVLDPASLYQIQKVYKSNRVIFEYCLCFTCQQALAKEYSKESTEKIQNYFVENYTHSESLEECHMCESKDILKERSLLALCMGDKLLFVSVICGQCTEKIQKVLSQQTRKAMGDFIQENFPGVPEEMSPAPVLRF